MTVARQARKTASVGADARCPSRARVSVRQERPIYRRARKRASGLSIALVDAANAGSSGSISPATPAIPWTFNNFTRSDQAGAERLRPESLMADGRGSAKPANRRPRLNRCSISACATPMSASPSKEDIEIPGGAAQLVQIGRRIGGGARGCDSAADTIPTAPRSTMRRFLKRRPQRSDVRKPRKGGRSAHQVHGAIGFTMSTSCIAIACRPGLRDDFGSESYWAVELGKMVAARAPTNCGRGSVALTSG